MARKAPAPFPTKSSATARPPATFGDLIAGTYEDCGMQKARGIVWLAVNARLVKFRGRERYLISKTLRAGSGK